MRKILIITLLFCFSLCAGCSALQQPAPAPEPTPSVVPETSKLGFSPVDLNKAPDVIKNIASDISKREAATWAQVNGTNYILASVGENTKYKIEITDIIQKIPAQDFILIEVKGKYVALKEGEKGGQVTAISLNPPNRTINGAGFEIVKAAAAAPTTPTPTTQTPAPAPAPAAQAPKTTPAPAPAPTTEQDKTPSNQNQNQNQNQTKKTQPSETNGENSNAR